MNTATVYTRLLERAEAAEARYEALKSTHIEAAEAIRAEYLGRFFDMQNREREARLRLAKAEARVLELEARIVEAGIGEI